MKIRCDNQAAVHLASSESLSHTRTKHIDIRHHYVREAVADGIFEVQWIPTEEQLADVFKKELHGKRFKKMM